LSDKQRKQKKNKPMVRQSLREVSQFVNKGLTMYVSKSMIFPIPHIGHSRHGLVFTRLNCQDLPRIRTQDLTTIPLRNKQHKQYKLSWKRFSQNFFVAKSSNKCLMDEKYELYCTVKDNKVATKFLLWVSRTFWYWKGYHKILVVITLHQKNHLD
jgi:hypothetical protein